MTALPMFTAYRKAAALADTTRQPAVVIALKPDTLDQYDAMTAEEYHRNPRAGFFFDVIAPDED